MLKLGARRQLTAWLGLVAMLFVSCIPLASQLIAAARNAPSIMICGLHEAPADVAAADSATASVPPRHKDDAVQTHACGYCNFFDHYTSLPPSLMVVHQLQHVLVTLGMSARPDTATLSSPYPSGRPRDPPGDF